MDLRRNIEKSKRRQRWAFLMLLLPGLCAVLFGDYFDPTPSRWTSAVLAVCVALLFVSSIGRKASAMDVQAIVARRKRLDRWSAVLAIVIAPCIWFSSNGAWTDRAWSALLVYGGFVVVRRNWLWRIGERRARELAETARRVGLVENPVNARVYEGMRRDDCVRVWIEEPKILPSFGLSAWIELALFAATFMAAGRLAWPWVCAAALAALAWSWQASRFRIRVVTSREHGTDERLTLYRVGDLAAAIGPDVLTPVEAGRFPMESEVDLPDLLAQVEIASDDNELCGALETIGEAGYPETIKLLLGRLRQRTEQMSPRSIAAAEAAVARIHERHHLPDSGTLAISDADEAGRLAEARQVGTLALPPRKRSGR